MKIKKITINNFAGIAGLDYTPSKKIGVLAGGNGAGKSSFLKAVRFALTGEGGVISDGADEMNVTVETEDADIPLFSRGIAIRNGKNEGKVAVNGSNGKTSYLNNELIRMAGVRDMDALKATTLSKVVANMNPADFGSFIMQYLPEKLTKNKILDNCQNDGMRTSAVMLLESELNDPVDSYTVDSLYSISDSYVEKRKLIKRDIAGLKSLTEKEPVKSARTAAEIDADLEKIAHFEAAADEISKPVLDYNNAVAAKARQDADIAALRQKLAEMADVTQPDPEKYNLAISKQEMINQGIASQQTAKNAAIQSIAPMQAAVKLDKRTLANLDKPVCPVSNKLICNTDKSGLKNELMSHVAELEKAILAQQEVIKGTDETILKYKSVLKQLQDWFAGFSAMNARWTEKSGLQNRLDALMQNPVVVPEKPVTDGSGIDYTAKKKELTLEKDSIVEYEKYLANVKSLEEKNEQLKDFDEIAKKLSIKGSIIKSILESYMSYFKQICDEKGKKLGLELFFEANAGVHISASFGKTKLPYNMLSSGERCLVNFLVLDVINALTGLKIMMLDDLDSLDKDAFKKLIGLINSTAVLPEYDHIFLATVAHTNIMSALKKLDADYIF